MNTKKVVLSGILCAICIILLFISGISFVFDYSILIIASAVILVAVIELSYLWALLIYIAASIITFVLSGARETVLLFVFFLGYYPILKSVFERLKHRGAEYFLKFIVFNLGVGACIFLFKSLFFSDQIRLDPVLVFIAALGINLIFFVYDIAMSKIAQYYLFKIKPKLKFTNK